MLNTVIFVILISGSWCIQIVICDVPNQSPIPKDFSLSAHMNSAFALFVLSLCAFVAVQASIEINVAHFAPAIEPRLADNAKSVDVWLWDADTFKAHAVFSPLFDSKSWQLLHENQVLADEDLATELRPFSTELGSTYQWARDAASPWLLKEFEWGHLSTTGNQEAAVEFVSPWRLMSQSPAENGAQLVDYYTCLVVLQQFIQSLVCFSVIFLLESWFISNCCR